MAAAMASAWEVADGKWWADERASSALTCKNSKTYEKDSVGTRESERVAEGQDVHITLTSFHVLDGLVSAPPALSRTLFMNIFVTKRKKKKVCPSVQSATSSSSISPDSLFCLQPKFKSSCFSLSHSLFSLPNHSRPPSCLWQHVFQALDNTSRVT